MLIIDWVFVDIKKLCDVFRCDNAVVFMLFKKSLNLLDMQMIYR